MENKVENDNNKKVAKAFAEFSCDYYGEAEISSYPECYDAAFEMAEFKDKTIKQFFIEHICPNIKVETNENGELLAESFIEVSEKRFELAEEIFNRYKEFEKRFI